MKRKNFMILAASALLLAACSNNPTPATSGSASEPAGTSASVPSTPVESSPVETSAEPYLVDVIVTIPETVKTVYNVGDKFDPTGIAVKKVYSDGTEVEVEDKDIIIDGADTSTFGTKTVKIGASGWMKGSLEIRVLGYEANKAALVVDNGDKVLVKVTGSYGGYTKAEFEALEWSADFQKNGGDWAVFCDEAVTFTLDEEKLEWSFTRDVTELAAGNRYIAHFGDHLVENDQHEMQKMDLKIKAEKNESFTVTAGGKFYKLSYNIGYDGDQAHEYGNLGLQIANEGEPIWEVTKQELVLVDPVAAEEGQEGKPGKVLLVTTVAFDNTTPDAFIALNWAFDLQRNANVNGGNDWSRHLTNPEDLTIVADEDGVATFTVNLVGLADGGYTGHFGVKTGENAPDFKPHGWADQTVSLDGINYTLDFDNDAYWTCFAVIVKGAALTYETAQFGRVSADTLGIIFGGSAEEGNTEAMLDADLQMYENGWGYAAKTAAAKEIKDGKYQVMVTFPNDIDNGIYFSHFFLRGSTVDVSMEGGRFEGFKDQDPIVIGTKSYTYKISQLWGRPFITLVVEDAPAEAGE